MSMLSEFSRGAPDIPRDPSARVKAGMLTALFYALFALLVWRASQPSPKGLKSEIVASLLSEVPNKRAVEPLPPVLARFIRPRAEQPALPVFTIASGAPPQAPAPLAASAAKVSPMQGGTAGDGAMGQAASGNGAGGNGAGSAGCLDPVWMRAVSERVRQFFYTPDAALASRITGVAILHFAVRRDGRIDRLEIGKSSGNEGLDKAALDIMRKAQPLPAIPDRMHIDRIESELPMNFGVRSFHGSPSVGHC